MNKLRIARLAVFIPLLLCVGLTSAEAKKRARHVKHKPGHAVVLHSPIAKDIFGRQLKAAPGPARAIGSYARGCLAGGKQFPIDGPAWQAMRLSRNRNWGHPVLLALLERFATEAQKQDNWPGLMVGDMAQPMGGPMFTGHASHQVGLDVDIWLKPMPNRILTREERETEAPVSMLDSTGLAVDPKVWTEGHLKLLKRAASYAQTSRIFVHPAIKKALCDGAGKERDWLEKVRPYWGHHYHFHIRMSCPAGMAGCENQPSLPSGDGCGKELSDWLKKIKGPPAPEPKTPPVKKHYLTLAELPRECAKLVGVEPFQKAVGLPVAVVPLPERRPVKRLQ